MRFRWAVVALLACALNPWNAAAQPRITADTITDEHVKKAIQTLATSLIDRMHADRFWEPEKAPAGESRRQSGGYTALALLALVTAGESYQDPRWRDAVDYLSKLEMQGTYAITTRASLWARLPSRFDHLLRKDARVLIDGFSESTGGWDYVPNPKAKYHDNSIRQFGALALWDAAKRNVKIDRRLWQRVEDAFILLQREDGGWNYRGDDPSTGSMTAAGLATLFITQDLLHTDEYLRLGKTSSPTATPRQKALDAGLKWMDKHFSPTANPGRDTFFFYYMYGVERVGLASGYKFFGGRDWFREGAAELIHQLCSWDATSETFHMKKAALGAGRTDDLAFALMFLHRGRVPVAFNKLQFPGAWNNRPRDLANLTRWMGETTEQPLNWQIVSHDAEPEQWLDAPILYIASHEPLPWMKSVGQDVQSYVKLWREHQQRLIAGESMEIHPTPSVFESPELLRLKRFIDLGGTVLAMNEGNSRGFADSIEKAGQLLYPQYDWRTLPESHFAYTVHLPVKGRRPPLRGLFNGVRDLIILSPGGDLPAVFQINDVKRLPELQSISNLFFAASELNQARPRLDRRTTAAKSPAAPISSPARSVTIARAMHESNWNVEPLAIERFAQWMKPQGVTVTAIEVPLSQLGSADPIPSLAVISGTGSHQFSETQIAAIKAFVARGGVVLFETPGGGGDFTVSAETALEAALGQTVEPLLHSRIVTGESLPHGKPLSQVAYREFLYKQLGSRETALRLRGITLNEQRGPQVLFSREDLSHALLDQPCWGINGYTTSSARDLMLNIVLHASTPIQSP